MAIVRSILIPSGRNSVGNVTLRKVRGRQIMSQKVGSNSSRTQLQRMQRFVFRVATEWANQTAGMAGDFISQTRFGSRPNNVASGFIRALRSFCISNNLTDPTLTDLYNLLDSGSYIAGLVPHRAVLLSAGDLSQGNEAPFASVTIELKRFQVSVSETAGGIVSYTDTGVITVGANGVVTSVTGGANLLVMDNACVVGVITSTIGAFKPKHCAVIE